MTICIAAICDECGAVVVTSDKMISAAFLDLEFEHHRSKLVKLGDNCVGLTAGDALANIDLFRAVSGTITQLQNPTVDLIANQVKQQFVELRRQKAEERLLVPRDLTIKDFYKEGMINRLPAELGFTIDNGVQNYVYPLEIIIAGVDETGAHIYGVSNPGVLSCYDSLGYHSVGSGERHALLSIISNEYCHTCDINEGVYLVYEAKKRAEVAQGVGKETEIGIITMAGLKVLNEEDRKNLQEVYDIKVAPQTDKVKKAVSKLGFNTEE